MLKSFKHNLNHVSVPPFIYGTAWKKEKTQMLTLQALENGYLGIDTANQLKHYFEEGVGLGIQQFLKNTGKSRGDLFLQTKFTPASSQDHNKPYNETDSYSNQVRQSFLSSLDHLQTDYIDSYILHGPTYYSKVVQDDLDIWKAMEDLYYEGKVRLLGVSNVDLEQLKVLYNAAVIKPSLVQNRCFASSYWDFSIRSFCKKHNILYQGFSLLTANQSYLLTNKMHEIATQYKKSIPQIIFRFALQIGIVPLTGTSNQQHMKEDLDLDSFELSSDVVKLIEEINKS
ncbi:aldo/keto reductase family protein [Legionella parisiensis]|nr:aldo/keto reductase [Legionella parisiensis]